MDTGTNEDGGEQTPKASYAVLGVAVRREVIRMQVGEDGKVCYFSKGLKPTDELEGQDLDGAFGMYLLERELFTIDRDGTRVEALSQTPLSVGPTLFHWDCEVMTARQHLEARPDDIQHLTKYLLEDEQQFLVTFVLDGERCYLQCEARDQILPRPPDADEEEAEEEELEPTSRGGGN